MRRVFTTNNQFDLGICHGMCCLWIKRCITLGRTLRNEIELGGYHQARNWHRSGGGNLEIIAASGLTIQDHELKKKPDAQWMTMALSRRQGYFIFGVGWFAINADSMDQHEYSGHSMATLRLGRTFQFLDPNEGVFEFDNSLEFVHFLPGYVTEEYPELFSGKADVWKVA